MKHTTKPKNRPETRFDPLWRNATVAYGELHKYTRRMQSNVREVRRHAYRFAASVKVMLEYHHNEFLAMIASEGVNLQQWLNSHFELIEAMGDNRERIFQIIESGCTEREYVAEGSVVLGKKRLAANKPIPTVVEPPPIAESASVEDKLADAVSRLESIRTERKDLRKRVAELETDLAVANRELEQLKRAIKRLEKQVEPIIKSG